MVIFVGQQFHMLALSHCRLCGIGAGSHGKRKHSIYEERKACVGKERIGKGEKEAGNTETMEWMICE